MGEVEDFLKRYEAATNSHVFDSMVPFIADNAVYWFTDGTFIGRNEIRTAFEKTWNTIQDEVYSIRDVQWIGVSETTATCLYVFHWRGIIDGVEKSGSGRGTNVLEKRGGKWLVVHEHLS